MSFKLFIYYCAICGGWAAFFTWALVFACRVQSLDRPVLETTIIAALLGAVLAGVVGLMDGMLNAVGVQRFVRASVCVVIGFFGSLLCGLVSEAVRQGLIAVTHVDAEKMPRFPGWIFVGVVIGLSVGIFDLVRALLAREAARASIKKVVNGVIGGLVGGLVGGLLFDAMLYAQLFSQTRLIGQGVLVLGLVILGLCIGLFIGLAQVILKDAWVRVEQGFRPGRELMLQKEETVIGRAESCDLGLFGDSNVEKTHARIKRTPRGYLLIDEGTPGGTYLNDRRIDGPTPLRAGDLIRLGRNVVVFGESQRRR